MHANDTNHTQARAHVSAGLPELPSLPAEIGPVRCPECDQRTAVIKHVPQGDGNYSAESQCSSCGDRTGLDMISYAIGLTVGILIEAARRADPRVSRQPR